MHSWLKRRPNSFGGYFWDLNNFLFLNIGEGASSFRHFHSLSRITPEKKIEPEPKLRSVPARAAPPHVVAVVAEWLRRLTRNQIPSGSVGSNPTDCATYFFSLSEYFYFNYLTLTIMWSSENICRMKLFSKVHNCNCSPRDCHTGSRHPKKSFWKTIKSKSRVRQMMRRKSKSWKLLLAPKKETECSSGQTWYSLIQHRWRNPTWSRDWKRYASKSAMFFIVSCLQSFLRKPNRRRDGGGNRNVLLAPNYAEKRAPKPDKEKLRKSTGFSSTSNT